MTRLLKFLIIAFLISNAAYSQNSLFSMDEAILKSKTTLAPKNLKQLNWIPNSTKYFFIDDVSMLIINDAKNKTKQEVNIQKKINWQLAKLKVDTLKEIPQLVFVNENILRFETKYKQIAYYFLNEDKVELRNSENNNLTNADYANKNEFVAFTVENNLRILTCLISEINLSSGDTWTKTGNIINVTDENNSEILNAAANVHRNEFGITKGTFWSPQNNYLAFYCMNQTMVNDYPIIDWTQIPATSKNIKYPMSGGKSHHVLLKIFDVRNKRTVEVKTEKNSEQYLTNITWSPDEMHIYIAILNRAQNHLKLNSYNSLTGDFEATLIEEKDEKYVEPLNPILFIKNNPKQFIWQSNKDGFNHLYLHDSKTGKQIRQLTIGNYEVLKVHGFNENGTKILYTANAESPICKDFYSVDLSSSKVTKLTNGVGTHSIKLSDNGEFFIDNFSNISIPNNVLLCDSKTGTILKTLLISENPISNYKLGDMSVFTIKNDNNDDLFCRLYKPIDFDSTKKYPAIVYLYNGPHVQVITNSWLGGAANLWFQYMAQKGYVVFSIDGRGSDNRGKAFEQAIHKQLGTVEMEDQLEGVDFLKSKQWIDASRLAIHGWSFGGFMTTSLMTRHPDVFKIGIAGGPVIDWSLYEVMYTERYMDSPQENSDGYSKNNLLNYVDNLKGKLLMIHGTDDDVVVWQHSMAYLKKCVDKGKQIDYFAYPAHLHNVLGKDRAHLFQKITDYIFQNL